MVYSLAKLENDIPVALENGVISNDIISLVDKNKSTIIVGAFIAEGKQLTESQNQDLKESNNLFLQSADGALTPIKDKDSDGNEYWYYWEINTNNIKCYKGYEF